MGGRGDGREEEAVEGAGPGRPPAATGLTNQRREAAERLCWRRRQRQRLPGAALPVLRGHGGTYARACVRSFRGAPTRRVPGRQKETEAGARRDTAPVRSRPPRAGKRARRGRVAAGGGASDPGACRGRLPHRIRPPRDGGVCPSGRPAMRLFCVARDAES